MYQVFDGQNKPREPPKLTESKPAQKTTLSILNFPAEQDLKWAQLGRKTAELATLIIANVQRETKMYRAEVFHYYVPSRWGTLSSSVIRWFVSCRSLKPMHVRAMTTVEHW